MLKDKNIVVCDLGFGDMVKGATVDAVCHKYDKNMVVRFNSGPNAMHNVVTDEGIHHTFSQFGSGTFAGAGTYLSEFVLVEPLALDVEAEILKSKGVLNPYKKHFIHENCPLITPFHIIANRLNSEGGTTVGMGIGVTVQDMLDRPISYLRIKDLYSDKLVDLLYATRSYVVNKYHSDKSVFAYDLDLEELSAKYKNILTKLNIIDNFDYSAYKLVFEGAQGALLDQDLGFGAPNYVTWSKTTKHNALTLLKNAGIAEPPVIIGCTRSYATRHGKGLFPTESADINFPEPHNQPDGYQGAFRQGYLDIDSLKYAVAINEGIDYLSVSHLDCPQVKVNFNGELRNLTQNEVLKLLAAELDAEILITARGARYTDRTFYGY